MKDKYDFSESVPNRHVGKPKKTVSIRFSPDLIEWLTEEGLKVGVGYQTFATMLLERAKNESVSLEDRVKKLEKAVFKKKTG